MSAIIRTALHNWLLARGRRAGASCSGSTTPTASVRTRSFVTAIRADLAWLGLAPDAEERQSARFDRYEARFAELKAAGRVYPAYETAQELELKRKVLLGRGLPPVYDRAALELSDADRAALEAEGGGRTGASGSIMLRRSSGTISIRGHQRFDPATMSDPVVRRADGSWLYMLPIGDRRYRYGRDPRRARRGSCLQHRRCSSRCSSALGAAPPAFAHEALLVGAEGKLSKRLGSLGVDAFP